VSRIDAPQCFELVLTSVPDQAELAHRKIRGKITSLQQLFNALGQIFATWIGYGCYETWTGTGDSREWRIPLAIQIIPALFLGALIFLFPESPRCVVVAMLLPQSR